VSAGGSLNQEVTTMANQPTLYELSGNGILVTYLTTSFTGQPQFYYQDAFQSKQFTGTQIQAVDTILGKLVTVFLVQTVDGGNTTFTLIVPTVNLPPSNVANITTEGITTLHKFSIFKPPQGQTEIYTFHRLHGTASFVVF
jgi:hypothetical protein